MWGMFVYIYGIWDVFVQYLFVFLCVFYCVSFTACVCIYGAPILTWEGGRSKSLLHILGRLESRDLNKRRNPYFHPYLYLYLYLYLKLYFRGHVVER